MPDAKPIRAGTRRTCGQGHRLLEHTADIGILAWGKTREDVLLESARGLCEILVNGNSRHGGSQRLQVRLQYDVLEELLVAWLNELIYLIGTRGFVPRELTIEHLDNDRLEATLDGWNPPPTGLKLKTEIKAATYHQILFHRLGDRWLGKVYLDL